VRRCHLPKLVDIRPRAFEVIPFERRFDLCHQIHYFLRIFRCVNSRCRGRARGLILRTEQFESEHYDGQHDGRTAAHHDGQTLGVELFGRRFEVGAGGPSHCRGFRE
jgi:hypothetical protein